ncbi:MAG: branched-chain amino acid ABC transporter permease [Pseudomonadota bacterium]
MFYREVGQFKSTYAADQQVFRVTQDRFAIIAMLAVAYLVLPFVMNDFWMNSIMIPFLVFSLAAIGLNIVTGFTGLLSLGTGGFMGVGAYAAYKLTTYFPDVNIIVIILSAGAFSALIGIFFGLPSLRIKGFYLAVATLAAQFFLEWSFIRVEWLYNYNPSGAIEVPTREVAGVAITGPTAEPIHRYLVALTIVVFLTWIANNVLRGRVGRTWMAIRDMDIAAELIGIRLLPNKLLAFAFSSYYCGVAGAMMVFLWLGAAEVESFDINVSFQVLFMVIIGGLGSLSGCFMGAALIWILPILIRAFPGVVGFDIGAATVEHIQFIIVGSLIIFFLIVEPAGLARLWQVARQKLRTWPFPY